MRHRHCGRGRAQGVSAAAAATWGRVSMHFALSPPLRCEPRHHAPGGDVQHVARVAGGAEGRHHGLRHPQPALAERAASATAGLPERSRGVRAPGDAEGAGGRVAVPCASSRQRCVSQHAAAVGACLLGARTGPPRTAPRRRAPRHRRTRSARASSRPEEGALDRRASPRAVPAYSFARSLQAALRRPRRAMMPAGPPPPMPSATAGASLSAARLRFSPDAPPFQRLRAQAGSGWWLRWRRWTA